MSGTQPGAQLLRAMAGHLTGTVIAVFAITAFCNLGIVAVSLYNMEIYNRVVTSRNLDTLTALSVGLVLVMALYGVLEYLRSCLYLAMGDRISRRLSLPVLLGAARQARNGNRLPAEQAMRDLNEIRLFVSGPSLPAFFDALWVPLFLAALFMMHWAYGLFAAVSGLLIFGFNYLSDLLAKRPLREANEAAAMAFGDIAVAVRHAEAVEAMGMLPAIARRWHGSQHAMLALLYRGTRLTKGLAAAAKSYRLMVTGGMVALGLVLSVKGEVSIGSMLAANILVARMLLPFEQIVTGWRQWVSALAAYRRIEAVLDQSASKRGTLPLPCPHGRLAVERLVYIPPGSDRPVLRGISFALEPGEVLGVIGPSGAGKSTLARLILGIVEPSSGGIYLDGNSTFLWEREDFGHHVGYVPQAISLVDGTVGENIARMRDADPRELIDAARRAGVHDMIAALPHGYETRIEEIGFTLSGGQRQRIALARALFGAPKLLVLDEPNANLDQDGESLLVEAIAGAKRDGIGVIMIAHRPSVMAVADKLLVLKDGMIDAFGARSAVMKSLAAPGGTAVAPRAAPPQLSAL